jgi:hypothetical protein
MADATPPATPAAAAQQNASGTEPGAQLHLSRIQTNVLSCLETAADVLELLSVQPDGSGDAAAAGAGEVEAKCQASLAQISDSQVSARAS